MSMMAIDSESAIGHFLFTEIGHNRKKINSDNILNEILQSNGLLMHSVYQKSSVATDILQK